MSDTDELANLIKNEPTQIQHKELIKLTPLYQLFTHKIIAILLTIIVMVGLTLILFYQNNAQNSALIETQLIPLTEELKHIKTLQKTENLIVNLSNANNAEKYVELHSMLIATNRQLLQQDSSNGPIFQQWLNENKLAEDTVSRIQDSHTRNQQLKQSSIIQLQLMILSITSIIDSDPVSKKSNDLQQLKSSLVDVLFGFEQLNMHTSIATFERLRLKVELSFSQQNKLRSSDLIKAMIEVNQQFDAFEKIVLTEQRALAKWLGYIRLVQDYQLDLLNHQQTIRQLLLTPYTYNPVSRKNIINDLLSRFDIKMSDKDIDTILVIAISLSLLLFFYLVLRLREKIKVTTQTSVELIQSSILTPNEHVIANCLETQLIINQVHSLAKPQHNEDEFQEQLKKNQSNQQLLNQQKQNIEQLTQCNEQQELDYKEQITVHLNNELLSYQLLEKAISPILQQHQIICFNQQVSSENNVVSVLAQLTSLRQKLSQCHLALEMKLEKSILHFSDINLADEIHAILFNKQQEQQSNDNQFLISFDEQISLETKLDSRLFEQLINLFIDISLTHCKESQLHFNLQLKDKSEGQQLVQFSAKVKVQSLDTLPTLITQLVESQSTICAISPLIEIFNTLFTKQHGENIVVQQNDEGYQLSFELPLAIANSTNNVDKVILENTNVMLLSTNTLLTELIENSVLSAKGKFEQFARIDSFKQQFTAKQLNRHKVDLLVVSSDIVSSYFNLITQKINELPLSLQPKLMVLQSKELDYERFGFYSQMEQIFCKEFFLQNIIKLLASNELNNQLLPCEPFSVNQYITTKLPLLLGVKSPQQYQNLQRLIHWLGLQVQIVANETAQQALWKTGQYSVLITEFSEKALHNMENKPLSNVGVFSLTGVTLHLENSPYFDNWSVGKLSKNSTVTELIDVLSPWLKQVHCASEIVSNSNNSSLQVEDADELVITEVAEVFTENVSQAAFDFAQYLQHQGSVELALFMLDDYTKDNHQQLDTLIEAIKTKNIERARLSISALSLNAKILSAQTLQSLCITWLKLLCGSEPPSSLNKVNDLLKNTRIVLNDIDEYAETI